MSSLDPLERLKEIARGRLLIRQGEAASALGISRKTLVAEVHAGRLRWVKIGKQRRFKPLDLVQYIKNQETGTWSEAGTGGTASNFAATFTTKTSPSTVVSFEEALKQATGTSPKPSSPQNGRRPSSAWRPAKSPRSR